MSSSRCRRGVIVSIELILLLSATMFFSVATFFGINKLVLQQAASPKEVVIFVRAEVKALAGNIVYARIWLHNHGDKPVHLLQCGVMPVGGGIKTSTLGMVLKAGEGREIGCLVSDIAPAVGAGHTLFVFVVYSIQAGVVTIGDVVLVVTP